MGDIISNFKIENPERPNKAIVYPFASLIRVLKLIFFYYDSWLFKLSTDRKTRWFKEFCKDCGNKKD